MMVSNVPKLVGIIVAMILLTGLAYTGRLSEVGYMGLMGLLVGYLVGNGVQARSDEPTSPPVLSRRE